MTAKEAEAEIYVLNEWARNKYTERLLHETQQNRVNLLARVLEGVPATIEDLILREQSVGAANEADCVRVFIELQKQALVDIYETRDKPKPAMTEEEM